MSEAKYENAPWTVHEYASPAGTYYILDANGKMIVAGRIDNKDNAVVMGAATDLYKALEDCIEALEHIERMGMKVNPPTLANAKAAIKKATP